VAHAHHVDQRFGLADFGHQAAEAADHEAALSWWPRRWAWVMATASASAESAQVSPAPGRRRRTMKPTWSFSAAPAPTTAFLTSRVAYSATGRPALAGAIRAQARAWPSFKVDEGFLLTNTSST